MINSSLIDSIMNFVLNKNFSNLIVIKCLETIYSICIYQEINTYVKDKYLLVLSKLLFKYSLERCYKIETIIGDNEVNEPILSDAEYDEDEIKTRIKQQLNTSKLLRIIYSFERNRKKFKHILPSDLLGLFIEIGNFKVNDAFYKKFITSLSAIPRKDMVHLLMSLYNNSHVVQKEINLHSSTNLQKIGGYYVHDLIGKGGFGDVYKVSLNGKYFAMKELVLTENAKKIFNKNKSLKFLEENIREIRTWKIMNHPNIVKYYSCFIENDKAYILMEYIDGINLNEYLAELKDLNTKLKFKDLIKIIIDIICALSYMHNDLGVVYGDLTPNNILLDSKLNIKISDFGLSKAINEKENISLRYNNSFCLNTSVNVNNLNHLDCGINHTNGNTNFVGNILYSSPEIIRGDSISFKSDIWAFGCILYEIIMLRKAFWSDNMLNVVKKITDLDYYKNYSSLSKEEERFLYVIENCLVNDVDKRFDILDIAKALSVEILYDCNMNRKYVSLLKTQESLSNNNILNQTNTKNNNVNANNDSLNKKENDFSNDKKEFNDGNFNSTDVLQYISIIKKITDISNINYFDVKIKGKEIENINENEYDKISNDNSSLIWNDILIIKRFSQKLNEYMNNTNNNNHLKEIIKIANLSDDIISFEISINDKELKINSEENNKRDLISNVNNGISYKELFVMINKYHKSFCV